MSEEYRIEKDIMGEMKIPNEVYYGIFTMRAKENFPISGIKIPAELNKSIIEIKMAAAQANVYCRTLDKKIGAAIVNACARILKDYSRYENQFIIDVFQAGAGTPWHMNVNEVVANIALELIGEEKGNYDKIDPHNHVNMAQSTNDVIPTAIRIASVKKLKGLISEISLFIKTLKTKEKEFSKLLKTGRTHLQDAVPITLGAEFGAYASDLEKRLKNLVLSSNNLYSLHIGGTAVGTGLNAHRKFSKYAVKALRKIIRLPFTPAKNKVEETQFMSDFLELSSSLRTIATDLNKISNDIRLLSSGPMTGLNEISLPEVEPGSSIMPSKFNPSIAEMMNMACYQVIGNDTTIQRSTEAGQLELNVMTPIIAHNLLQSITILTNGIREFNARCVSGIKANQEVLKKYLENNLTVGTILNPILGYNRTAELIRHAARENKSIKEVLIEKNIMNKNEVEAIFSKIT